MELIDFQKRVEKLNSGDSEEMRARYIRRFVNVNHPHYEKQIFEKHLFRDGWCYLGYLWDYMHEPVVVDEKYIEKLFVPSKEVMVFWDIHSNERILIQDYWKFDKNAVLKMQLDTLLEGEIYLPEDIYVFDESFSWTFVKTHEDLDGIRYCLKAGDI